MHGVPWSGMAHGLAVLRGLQLTFNAGKAALLGMSTLLLYSAGVMSASELVLICAWTSIHHQFIMHVKRRRNFVTKGGMGRAGYCPHMDKHASVYKGHARSLFAVWHVLACATKGTGCGHTRAFTRQSYNNECECDYVMHLCAC